MANRHSFQDGDLVPDHMLSTCHEALVNHLSSIVSAGIDVDAFFDDGVGASSEGLACLVSTWLYDRFLSGLSHLV